MKCPNVEQWTRLTLGAQDHATTEALRAHLQTCASCRRACEQAQHDHEALRAAHVTFDRDHDARREQLLAALPADDPRVETTRASGRWQRRLGDLVMSIDTTTTRRGAAVLLTAACIALVVYLGVAPNRALGAAVARLRDAETIRCRVRMTMTATFAPTRGAEESGIDQARLAELDDVTTVREEQLYIRAHHGMRRDVVEGDALTTSIFADPAGNAVIIDHDQRTYQDIRAEDATQFSDELQDAMRDLLHERPIVELHFAGPMSDPLQLITGLQNLTGQADRSLGTCLIEGQRVTGVELDGARVGFGPPLYDEATQARAELWIDRCHMPVRVVLHLTSRIGAVRDLPMSATFTVTAEYTDFELDPPLPEDWFEPAIPEDFTERDHDLAQLQERLNEEGLLAALRAFADASGRYPRSLRPMDLTYEVSYVIGALQARHLVAKRKGEVDDTLPDINEVGQTLQGLAFFTILETSGRAPLYAADVQPANSDDVLLRWTDEDGGQRVIYGDLHVETVP